MHAKTTMLAITALALMAGCNRGAANNSAKAGNTTTANTTIAAAPAVAPAPAAPVAAGSPVDAAFLTANPWAPAGMCAQAMTFNEDGTASMNGEEGTWELAGDTLTMQKEGGTPRTIMVARSGDNLVMTKDGQAATASACPG